MTAGAVSDAEWRVLCRALERPEWLADPRFATPTGRIVHVQARLELTAAVLRTRTTAEWLERLDREPVPCAPILTREELLDSPAGARERDPRRARPPDHGTHAPGAAAARFARPPRASAARRRALGEHSRELLREVGVGEATVRRSSSRTGVVRALA